MRIKKSAIGNGQEAFIQPFFDDKLNIISSDDNNKGKTIEIQSMMYALGNEPVFPATFNYKKYYHYIEFEENDTTYKLCRTNEGFVLKYNSVFMLFDNVSELKRYWNKYIFKLPTIVKNQISKIVDPVLFLQLFFVGQDKKDTSNIAHNGYYKKEDFLNMLFDICNLSGIELNERDIERINKQIAVFNDQKRLLLKQYSILSSTKKPLSYISTVADRNSFGKTVKELEKVNYRITVLRKARNSSLTKRMQWETTLKELSSLNNTIDNGELRCMDCNSTNIAFSSKRKGGYTFDVSTIEMRREIIASISEKIEVCNEEIEKINEQISREQELLQALMREEDITLESIVEYKKEIFSSGDAELKIKELDERIEELKSQLLISTNLNQGNKSARSNLISGILDLMNVIYKQIDPNGNLFFENLFTKNDEVYSGSEATVFHLVKIYALAKVLNHDYPIIIDSFRAEDLSTAKESIVLELFKQIPNQVIFTTTLKTQELGKYDDVKGIYHIDYKDHLPSKMLTENYVEEFKALLTDLSIQVN